MKKIGIFLILLLAVGLCVSSVQAAEMKKIGFADLSRLFDEYYKTKDYDKVLKAKQDDYEKTTKAKVDEIRDMESKLAVLKEDKKDEQQKVIDKMKADLLENDRQQKTELNKERNKKISEILLEIEKIVSAYAEKEGYSLILNDRVLVYGNDVFNITEDILKILNNAQPKK
ncbi:MAG: OmpH family outer membrane protein [Candidatus Omnitrophica bacterium]|nr:OmpH family outer membrane protein [Candidatus Omnitrophota bacterium]